MSMKMLALAWMFRGDRTHKLVLLALADFADRQGEGIRPSQATLAAKVCCTDRQVRRVLRDLVAARLIEPVANRGGGRPGASVVYKINVEQLMMHVETRATPDTDVRPTPDADVRPHQSETADILNMEDGHFEQKPRTPMSDDPKEEPKEEPKERGKTLRVSLSSSEKKYRRKKTHVPDAIPFTDKHRALADEARARVDTEWDECRDHFRSTAELRADWGLTFNNWLRRTRKFKRVPEPIDWPRFFAEQDARETAASRQHRGAGTSG